MNDVVPAGIAAEAAGDQPRLVVALRLGRGRTGGSTLLDLLVQLARAEGRPVLIGDGDRRNPTLAAHYPPGTPGGASQPPTTETADMKDWVSTLVGEAVEGRSSLVLDLGGGDAFLQEYGRDLELVPFCEAHGASPLALFTMGPDADDWEHVLTIWRAGYFRPRRSVLVFNEHLVAQGRTPKGAFRDTLQRPECRGLVDAGAQVLLLPNLPCMAEVRRSGLGFLEVVEGKPGRDGRPFDPVRRFMVRKWVADIQGQLSEAGALGWLP